MKKYIITALLILVSFASVFAQDDDNKKYEKIRAIRVSFISERVRMSSEQSARFWPIYDAYQNERRNTRRSYVQRYLSTHAGATREQARASLEGNTQFQEEELELKKKYNDRLLQVISQQQLDQLYEAERAFKQVLIDRLKDNG